MIQDKPTGVMGKQVESLMIRADNVAIVSPDNSLDHALLILTNSGYSAVPVLDRNSIVQGTINTNLIMNAIAGMEGYNVDSLHELTVDSVMNQDVPTIQIHASVLKALELTINRPFLCVEDESGRFAGLLTRKSVLAAMYQHFRELGLRP